MQWHVQSMGASGVSLYLQVVYQCVAVTGELRSKDLFVHS